MVILWQDYCEKGNFEKIPLQHGWEKVSSWECLFIHRGPYWAPRHADSDCLPVPMDEGWNASRELPSVLPGCVSTPPSSWQSKTDTSAPTKPWVLKRHFFSKPTEPPEDTPVVVESLVTPAPLTPCVHESTHPVQFGIMPKRLPLPHPDDEILSGYEEDLSSIQEGYTAWVMADPETPPGQ